MDTAICSMPAWFPVLHRWPAVIGGPYSSGTSLEDRISSTRWRADIEVIVARLKTVADAYRVPIRAAALQFCLAHPQRSRTERGAEDHAALATAIPDEFWHELRRNRLVSPVAPLPIDR